MESLENPLHLSSLILWTCCLFFALIVATISFKKLKKGPEGVSETQRDNLITWTYFFIILAISIILQLIWRFTLSDELIVEILERASNSLFYFACFVKVLNIEKSVIKLNWYKRYYFSFIIWITIFVNIFVPTSTLKTISLLQGLFIVLIAVGYFMFPLIYLYVAKKSTGQTRRNAFKVNRASLLLFFGFLFRPENLIDYRTVDPSGMNPLIDALFVIGPITILLGILLIFDSFRKVV